MKKAVLALLILCLSVFSSCSSSSPGLSSFSLELTVPKTTIQVGEKVTFMAELKNLTDKEYTLMSLQPLVWLVLFPEGKEPEYAQITMVSPTTIEPGESITETLDFQPTSPGKYILKSFSSEFEAKEGNEPFHYYTSKQFCYSLEEVSITVVFRDE